MCHHGRACHQAHLQPRNGLEGVVIGQLAGDRWKSDRVKGSAGARISIRLRHDPVDQSRKDADEDLSWASICYGRQLFRCLSA